MADVVAARDVGQCLIADVSSCDGFATLVRCQLARASEPHAMGLGTLAALAGAGNDQVAPPRQSKMVHAAKINPTVADKTRSGSTCWSEHWSHTVPRIQMRRGSPTRFSARKRKPKMTPGAVDLHTMPWLAARCRETATVQLFRCGEASR